MKDPLPDHACSWCKEEQEKRGRRAWVTNLNLDTLHLGDMVELGERIPDESVDVIFTDPPYLKDLYQNAYARLAVLAARVLKPHGFLFTYAPQTHLDDIMDILRYSRLGGQEQNLQYFWVIESLNSGAQTAKNHQRNAICLHKPILVFQKAPEGMPLKGARRCFADVVRGLRQKQFHPWQQSVHDVLGIISRFCVSGDIVLDPYAGTGTTLKAANLLGLNWIGFEIDQKTHAIAVREMQQKPIGLFSFGGEEPEPAPAREAETPTDNSRQVSIGDPPAKKGSTGKAARTPMETLADEAKEQFIRVPENIVNPEPFIQQCCGTCGHHKGRKTFHDSCPRLGELLFKGGTKSAKVLMEETSRTPCEQYIEKGE
jgi:site-specific DNA-methyltransferase (adenine-specific)